MTESIWKKPYSPEDFDSRCENTAVSYLGIRCVEVGPAHLSATMPVDERTKQPLGLLHGGASVLLAESIMSTAGNWVVDFPNEYCVGQEINANHVRSARSGEVLGIARPVHLGRSSQVWETRIEQGGKLLCISRMTLAVLRK
jgi:1,4-dihydroxy-2-naphthoyl-CoA hydrolase